MKSLSNKVYKNYQINMGVPFQVKLPLSLQTIKQTSLSEVDEKEEEKDTAQLAEETLAKAREDADLIVREAQLEAQRILEKAKAEAEESRRLVLEEAQNNGYLHGEQEAKDQYRQMVEEAEAIRESASVECAEVLSSIEEAAVDVILEIAKTVIGRDTKVNRDSILYIVKQGFEKCSNREGTLIRLSSEDYEYLLDNREKLSEMCGGADDLTLKKDPSLEMGGCIIETSFGSVDAGADTKLKKIRKKFRNTAAG